MQHSLLSPLQSLQRAPLALVLRCRQKWNCRPSSLGISGKEAGLGLALELQRKLADVWPGWHEEDGSRSPQAGLVDWGSQGYEWLRGLEARDGSGMGAWARPGCAEIGSEREGRTGS